MAQWQPPRMRDIHSKLRNDFRRVLRESYGFTDLETDPILEVLFRSLAVQIEDVYEQAAETIPKALLDELMTGLGMPARRVRPAQTVVRFSLKEGRELLEEGTELIGEAKSKQKFTFALDTEIEVSPARIALLAVFQEGSLELHQGVELPKEVEAARPSFDPVPADLGRSPAIFVAIDVEDSNHLGRHGIYFQLVPEAQYLRTALQRETWCLLDGAGEIQARGMLRSRSGNAGVRRLEWLVGDTERSAEVRSGKAHLPEGFYGGSVFLFPEVPPERRFLTRIPRQMEGPLNQIFQDGAAELFDRERAWIRIALPQEADAIAADIDRVALHCATASNVEILNQTIRFDEVGSSIPVSDGSGRVRHFVRPLSIKGERGTEYVHESQPVADRRTGRYGYRRGRLEIEPARTMRGEVDAYANVRVLLSNGRLKGDDSVGAGGLTTFVNRATPRTMEIRNVNAAAGGTDEEPFKGARQRFSEILLSRERILSRADLEAVIKAYEPKVQKVRSRPLLKRSPDGLRRVQLITLELKRDSFTAPDEEAQVLQHDLEAHLQERALLGLEIQVAVEWI